MAAACHARRPRAGFRMKGRISADLGASGGSSLSFGARRRSRSAAVRHRSSLHRWHAGGTSERTRIGGTDGQSQPTGAGSQRSANNCKRSTAILRATITLTTNTMMMQVATRDAISATISKGEVSSDRPPALRVLGLERVGPGRRGRRLLRAADARGERACLKAARAQHEVADGAQLEHDSCI